MDLSPSLERTDPGNLTGVNVANLREKIAVERTVSAELSALLQTCIDQRGSDLHLDSAGAAFIRIDGKLTSPSNLPSIENLVALLTPLLTADELSKLASRSSSGIDLGISGPDNSRFRAHIAPQDEGREIGVVFRRLPEKFLTLEEIGLQPIHKTLLDRPRGLILVTGPTGSGKTTTLASMINYINGSQNLHIITIEDPIEYVHRSIKSRVTQRAVGIDVPTFDAALRGALRDDPDVILVGEIRDQESATLALRAAETGHLVLGTLHTPGAARTVDRLVGMFPEREQSNVRNQLAVGLCGVFSQTLVTHASGQGQVAAFEVLLNNSAVGNLIRKGDTHQIPSIIQTGKSQGMMTLDDHLLDLVNTRRITQNSALGAAFNREELSKRFK